MPMTEWKMKQLRELSTTDEEYRQMYEGNETIGQVKADRDHLRGALSRVRIETADLRKLVKNQTVGGEAQRGIIRNMRDQLGMCNEKRGWLERELKVFTTVTDGLRIRLKISQELAEDRQQEVDTRQHHVDDLVARLSASNGAAKLWCDQVEHLKDENKQIASLEQRLQTQQSYTKGWRQQVEDLKLIRDELEAALADVTKERDMIIALSNESLDKLHDIEALVR